MQAASIRIPLFAVCSIAALSGVFPHRQACARPRFPGSSLLHLQGVVAVTPFLPSPSTAATPDHAQRPQPKGRAVPPTPPVPPSLPVPATAAGGTAPITAPVDAAGALDRARAAYEYGDIDEMVEAARAVADGRLRPSSGQRASALRYLGIGLYLTGRAEGAETAFFELLRLRPESHLDPQTTRPDVVAFFEQVRARYAEPIRDAARASNRKTFAWNFLPPIGQIQNGHTSRAIIIGGLELVSLGSAISTFAVLKSWRGPHETFPGRQDEATFLRQVNWISIGVLGATFLYGVIDGIAHYGDPAEDTATGSDTGTIGPRASLTPTGLQLRF